jgi:hypothetical protein
MTVSRRSPQARPSRRKGTVGLLAIGSSGPWEIAIDQTLTGPDRWFAQIEGPRAYLSFQIPSLEIIDQVISRLADFQGDSGKNAVHAVHHRPLTLGTGKGMQVSLLRDDEFNDRYFLLMETKSGPCVRFTLGGDDLRHLLGALLQVKQDLE